MTALLDLEPDRYTPHPLHLGDRIWAETNCYVDLWVELLHALGLDPLAAAAFTLASDFDGTQWTFFKYPIDDLRLAYGIDVGELNVWRSVEDHIVEHLRRGRLLTVEADSWFLPDTAGVSYKIDHTKSTIVANRVDAGTRQLDYFHNSGFHRLEGDDFDGVLRRLLPDDTDILVPYVELVRLDEMVVHEPAALTAIAIELAARHLARRPLRNPVAALAESIAADVPWLQEQGLDFFHRWAFGTCRQCGANAEVAAAFVRWLDDRDGGGLEPVADDLREVAEQAKALQFQLARAARGRAVELSAVTDEMAMRWERAIDALARRYGT